MVPIACTIIVIAAVTVSSTGAVARSIVTVASYHLA